MKLSLLFFAATLAVAYATYCGAPPYPRYGGHNGGSRRWYYVGNTVKYWCRSGYRLQGSPDNVCLYNRYRGGVSWARNAPLCIPYRATDDRDSRSRYYDSSDDSSYDSSDDSSHYRDSSYDSSDDSSSDSSSGGRVRCRQLSPPRNGYVKFAVTLSPGSYAKYGCKSGYRLWGNTYRKCLTSGYWGGSAPTCKANECPELSNPSNGRVKIMSGRGVGADVWYVCDPGYTLIGSESRLCGNDLEWYPEAPICKSISCGEPESPANGWVRFSEGTGIGASAWYFCRRGFELVGSESRMCQSDGTWQPEVPQCKRRVVTCSQLEPPAFGSVELMGRTIGSTATYSCQSGYVVDGMSTRECQQDGEWSGQAPTCKRVGCESLDDPENGQVQLSGTSLGSFAKYFCMNGFVLVGNRMRKCLSSGWSGRAPTCQLVDCGDIPAPKNGDVQFSSGTFFGSVASYTCLPDYQLRPAGATRECQADGDWSGDTPACVVAECPQLDPPVNGKVDLDGTVVGSTATYSCNPGYELEGEETQECLEGAVWSGEAPICRKIPMCRMLPNPPFGSVEVSGQTVGSTATYTCEPGYRPIGDTERTCGSDGAWSGLEPRCVFVTCGNLPSPANGRVELSGTTFMSVAEYSCNFGFILAGEATRECEESGEWSGAAPTCERDCGPLDDPESGTVSFTTTTEGSEATYSCIPGYELKGVESRTCTSDGWSDTEPTCEAVLCDELFNPPNGEVSLTGDFVGSTATYTCNTGYVPDGNTTRECLATGQWSGSEPTCNAIMCGPLTDPDNGQVSVTSEEFGGTATYDCDDGFLLIGEMRRFCEVAGWSGQAPTCQSACENSVSVRCDGNGENCLYTASWTVRGDFISFEVTATTSGWVGIGFSDDQFMPNSDVIVGAADSNGSFIHDRYAVERAMPPIDASQDITNTAVSVTDGDVTMQFTRPRDSGDSDDISLDQCRFLLFAFSGNFNISQNTIMYHGPINRTFSAERVCFPTADFCPATSCAPLSDPTNGMVMMMGNDVGSKAMYSCELGFMLMGDMSRVCLPTGVWSGEEPTCKSNNCDPLDDPDNGVVVISGTTVGSSATYSCNLGFILNGQQTRFCESDREWSGSAPTCDPIDCGSPPRPAFGTVQYTTTTLSSRAIYSCNPGYFVEGKITRICLFNGRWSGNTPLCVMGQPRCPILQNPPNGEVTQLGNLPGSSAVYTCNDGYVLSGESPRTCLDTGDWSGQEPICEPVDCGILPSPIDAIVIVNTTTLGSVAMYVCNTGFTLDGVETRVCTITGEWSDVAPVCIAIECDELQDPINGQVELSLGTAIGSTANYLCEPGFFLIGGQQRICQESGEWSGTDPECIVPQVNCGNPGTPINGRRLGNNFTVGSIVYFRCRDDYDIVGSRSRQCQDNGQWSGTQPTCTPFNDTCLIDSNEAVDRCGRRCQCVSGRLINCCRTRIDYAGLTTSYRLAYINAVLTIAQNPLYKPRYDELVRLYKASFDNGLSQSTTPTESQYFMFIRYFLLEYEDLLKEVDCRLSIPFYDWTPFPDNPYNADVWSNDDGFGDSSRPEDLCVVTGPFRVGEYELTPSAGGGCLRREYRDQRYPTRDTVTRDLLTLTASEFNGFHRFLQLFIGVNVQCFVGGTMCGMDAANDPVFLLHLAQIDSLMTRWLDIGNKRENVRYASDSSLLVLSPGFSVADFSDNLDLPYGTCVQYDEPVLLKNHAPPPVALAAAQVSPSMDCAPESSMEFMQMSHDDHVFMEGKCGS